MTRIMVDGKTVIEFRSSDEYNGFELMTRLKLAIHNVAPNQYLVDRNTIKILDANHVRYKIITEIKK